MVILTNCRRAAVIALLALAAVVGGYAQAFSIVPGTLGFPAIQAVYLPAYGLELDRSGPQDFSAILNLEEGTNGGGGVGSNARRSIPASHWVHAICMMAYGLGTLGYWVDFYTSGDVRTSGDQSYVDFESSFTLADAFMAASYTTSAVLLLLQQPLAIPAGLVAGGSSIYLGCMDLLYDLQHNKFNDMTPSMAFETSIIATSFVLGAVTIVRLWLSKDRLEEGSAQ